MFKSDRPLYSVSLRSTLSSSMVNELRTGFTAMHGSSRFGQPSDPSQGAGSFADIGGMAVVIPLGHGLVDGQQPELARGAGLEH